MKREAELAIKIDDLTAQLSSLKGVQALNDDLSDENSLLKQQLDYLKLQLQDGFQINRDLQAEC